MKHVLTLLLLFIIPCVAICQTPANDPNWNSTKLPLSTDFNANWSTLSDYWIVSPESNSKVEILLNNILINTTTGIMTLKTKWDTGLQKYTCGAIYQKTPWWPDITELDIYMAYSPYGYYESRLVFAPNPDMWDCFWMIGGGDATHAYREIDISERHNLVVPGYNTKDEYHSSTCVYYTVPPSIELQTLGGTPVEFGSSTSLINPSIFHTYAVEWSPQTIIIYLDGTPVREIYNDLHVPSLRQLVTIGSGPGPELTLANGPYFSENNMYVDYIYGYVLKTDCDVVKTILNNTQLSAFNYKVYKSITINGSSSAISVPSNAKIAFRATDYVDIIGDVSIPIGAEFGIYPTRCPVNPLPE